MALQAVATAVAVAGTANSISQSQKAAKAQKTAAAQSVKAAKETSAAQERAVNKANQKKPNIAQLMAGNQSGPGTLLTGASGAPVSTGQLGTNTLLGQ